MDVDEMARAARESMDDDLNAAIHRAVSAQVGRGDWYGDVDPPTVHAHSEALEAVLRQLIENGLSDDHNPRAPALEGAPSTPVQELIAALEQSRIMADGEAVDAYIMLSGNVRDYLVAVDALEAPRETAGLPDEIQNAIDLLADWAVANAAEHDLPPNVLRDFVAGSVTAAITDPDYEGAADAVDALDARTAAAMLAPSFAVGDRVRLRRDVERYPHFIARAGSTGSVANADASLLSVRLDETLEGSEEWDNEVYWSADQDEFRDIRADLERI